MEWITCRSIVKNVILVALSPLARDSYTSILRWSIDSMGVVLHLPMKPLRNVERHLGIRAAGVPWTQSRSQILLKSLSILRWRPSAGCLPFVLIGMSSSWSIGLLERVT